MRAGLRLAYLTTHYPALSHTFIAREVAALRRRGVSVHTVSLRRATGEHLISDANRAAARSTYAVRPPRAREVVAVHGAALARHPRAYVATLAEAIGLARCGPRGVLWQLFYFAEALLVWNHCRRLGLAHIHAHHGSAPADVALLAAAFGRRASAGPASWSVTVHGPAELNDVRWFGLAEKVARAAAVVCISKFARSQLMALLDERSWEKLRVVHCGLRAAEHRLVAGAPAGTPRVLCVGRLVAEKGHAVLLRALALLAAEGRDVEVVLVGSGPERAPLEALARRLGIEKRVEFTGALAPEEVRRRYAHAHLMCSPSFAEGVPVVLMEAMASGCPVLATAIAGVRELVLDGETGLLVAPGSERELARAIATLLDDPELCARLASAARAHVCGEFDVDRSAAQLHALFEQLTGRPEAREGVRIEAPDPPRARAAIALR